MFYYPAADGFDYNTNTTHTNHHVQDMRFKSDPAKQEQ